MSSLSINGLGQGLSQFFQGVSSATGPSPAASPTAASGTSAASSASSATSATAGSQSAGAQKAGRHHHHHGGGKLFDQIQNAVTSALQSAQSGGTTSDPNKVIEDAIAKVFKQATGASSTSSSSTSTVAQPGGADPDDDTDAAGVLSASSSQQAFFKSLQALGVTPQQFQNDFLSAVKDAQQGGPIDVSAALKSLPVGSTLDAIG